MEMLRLNIRHALPQTDLRIRHGRFNSTAYVPAEVHTEFKVARSNKTVSQTSVQLDNYQSRKAWGAKNLTDLIGDFARQALSDVRSGTSRRTQIAWDRAENGGKPGDDIKQQIMQEVHAEPPRTMVEFELMEGPTITVTPSQIIGESDVGDVTAEIDTTPFANIDYTPGSVETYLKNEGFIRRWVSVNEYDIYA